MTTNKFRKPISAEEHKRAFQANPELVAQREAREKERSARIAQLREEEQPILKDLKTVGCEAKSVWDLVNTRDRYSDAIPVLMKHLLLPYSDRIREGIARALAVPEAKEHWATLLSEYRRASWGKGPDGLRLGAKDGLACALSAISSESVIGELIDLVKEQDHGPSRLLLLKALRKSKNPLAKRTLEEVSRDPDLAKEIASWK